MQEFMTHKRRFLPLFIGLLPFYVNAVEYDVSGFARVVTGVLDEPNVSYYDYDDSFSLKSNSLIGIQGEVELNKHWSTTVLGLKRGNSALNSGIEWLYLTYQPTEALRIKAGRMQTPFFALSDVLDVGYAYPWVIAPKEVYNDAIFKHFEGIDARYSFVRNGYSIHFESYYGKFDGNIPINHEELPTQAKDLYGLITDLSIDKWQFRVSYHSAYLKTHISKIEQLSDLLEFANFTESAAQLNTQGDAKFYQFSAIYDSLSYFAKSEFTKTIPELALFPTIESFYLSAGYYLGNFTTYLTYSIQRDTPPEPLKEIPRELNLAIDYETLLNERTEDDIDSWAIGVRWDFKPGMALKAEYKHIESARLHSSSFEVEEQKHFDQNANLLLLAWELVF